MRMKVHVVGVGKMGLPMARHLAAAGYRVTVSDPSPERCQLARAQGLEVSTSPAAALAAAEVVLSSLPNDAALLAVAAQVAAHAQVGAIYVDTSTVSSQASAEAAALTHPEWLALLLDRESTYRHDRKLAARLRYARLRQQALVEDIDYRAARGLDRPLFQKLVAGDWIDAHDNLTICGPTGVGKSWLACALGHKACRDNRSVLYQRVPKLFPDLALARGDGRYRRLMKRLGKVGLLILDDWGLEPFGPDQRRDLLEIVEERYGRGATLITSQIPVDRWHDVIGEPTIADAILDRIVHNAHRLKLKGDSLRRKIVTSQPAA